MKGGVLERAMRATGVAGLLPSEQGGSDDSNGPDAPAELVELFGVGRVGDFGVAVEFWTSGREDKMGI